MSDIDYESYGLLLRLGIPHADEYYELLDLTQSEIAVVRRATISTDQLTNSDRGILARLASRLTVNHEDMLQRFNWMVFFLQPLVSGEITFDNSHEPAGATFAGGVRDWWTRMAPTRTALGALDEAECRRDGDGCRFLYAGLLSDVQSATFSRLWRELRSELGDDALDRILAWANTVAVSRGANTTLVAPQ